MIKILCNLDGKLTALNELDAYMNEKYYYTIFLHEKPIVRCKLSLSSNAILCWLKEEAPLELMEYARLMYEHFCVYSFAFLSIGKPDEILKFKLLDGPGNVLEDIQTENLRFHCPRNEPHDVGNLQTIFKFTVDNVSILI